MHEILMNEGRVYVNWRSCKVRDFVNVLRCHRCFAFGHMIRECNIKRLCKWCGESRHLCDKCKNACICRNCELRGRKSDHSVMSQECQEHVRMVEREREREWIMGSCSVSFIQLNQRAYGVLCDVGRVLYERWVNVALLQEVYVSCGSMCRLPSSWRVFTCAPLACTFQSASCCEWCFYWGNVRECVHEQIRSV